MNWVGQARAKPHIFGLTCCVYKTGPCSRRCLGRQQNSQEGGLCGPRSGLLSTPTSSPHLWLSVLGLEGWGVGQGKGGPPGALLHGGFLTPYPFNSMKPTVRTDQRTPPPGRLPKPWGWVRALSQGLPQAPWRQRSLTAGISHCSIPRTVLQWINKWLTPLASYIPPWDFSPVEIQNSWDLNSDILGVELCLCCVALFPLAFQSYLLCFSAFH